MALAHLDTAAGFKILSDVFLSEMATAPGFFREESMLPMGELPPIYGSAGKCVISDQPWDERIGSLFSGKIQDHQKKLDQLIVSLN